MAARLFAVLALVVGVMIPAQANDLEVVRLANGDWHTVEPDPAAPVVLEGPVREPDLNPPVLTDYVSVADGDWDNSAIWSPTGVPGATDNVTINHRVVVPSTQSVNNITIGMSGKLVISGAYTLQVYGDWTNNGTDSLTNGYVFLMGSTNSSIGGTSTTSFYRLRVNKDAMADTVTMNQDVTVTYNSSSALYINGGTLNTNGYDLTVNASISTRVEGNVDGRLLIQGGSTVTIAYLYQWGLRYCDVLGSGTVLNITYRHDIANSGHRFDVHSGTVNYTSTGTSYNLQLYTNNAGWGWFATGGDIFFNGSIRVGNFVTSFLASGSATLHFAGSQSSNVILHSWSSSAPVRCGWWLNDMRVEKTGFAGVTFYTNGTIPMDSMVRATDVTVNSGAGLTLSGMFASGFGYDLGVVTNTGTMNLASRSCWVSGNWTGGGTMAAADSNTVIFDGTTTMSGTGLTFGGVSITGTLTAPPVLTAGGNWTCAGTFNHSSGDVWLRGDSVTSGGEPFFFLGIDNDTDGNVVVADDVAVEDMLSVGGGTFLLGAHTLTLGTASVGGAVDVDNGATFSAVGAGPTTRAEVTAVSADYCYDFDIWDGTIAARYADFTWMDGDGINVSSFATIDATDNFSFCTFTAGNDVGAMLTVANSQVIAHMDTVDFVAADGYNIDYTSGTGSILVVQGGGSRWGEDYDNDPSDLVDWYVPAPDAGVASIEAPSGTYAPGASVNPSATWHNYGNVTVGFEAWLILVDPTDAEVFREKVDVVGLDPDEDQVVDYFPNTPVTLTELGTWTVRCSTGLAGDVDPENDELAGDFMVGRPDLGVKLIEAPKGRVDTGAVVTPQARLRNYGELETGGKAWFALLDPTDALVYSESVDVAAIPVNAETSAVFPDFNVGAEMGDWTARCSVYVFGDVAPGNDVLEEVFTVSTFPDWPVGWVEVGSMPPGARPVKDGGWLAYDDGSGLVYATRGYKTGEFFCYEAWGDSWSALAPMPEGVEGKLPRKGSRGVCDGQGALYATKGNNSFGFWKYDIGTNAWTQLPDVPEGPSRKKVKGGTDLAWVEKEGTGYVYLLKGYRTEFYRFNTTTNAWETLENVPWLLKEKWDKGSWLAHKTGHGHGGDPYLYAHQAKYYDRALYEHQMFRYDLTRDSWDRTPLHGMPLYGLHGGRIRKKKAKDGSAGAYNNGMIYALKGGNTQQFWRYDIAGDSWSELDTIPTFGSAARKRRVKHGADLIHWGGEAFFALKGNKTNELWRYVLPEVFGARPERSGAMAGRTGQLAVGLTCAPNPLTAGRATVRYSLPKAGPAQVRVFDVTGRTVLRRSLKATRTGAVSLDVSSLPAGTYLVRLETDGWTGTQKLVVQH